MNAIGHVCCVALLGAVVSGCGQRQQAASGAAPAAVEQASGRSPAASASALAPASSSSELPAVDVTEFVGHSTLTGLISYVKLEALSEVDGKPWSSMAELDLIDATGVSVPRVGWTARADSFAANDLPEYAIDGKARSMWHTQWDGAEPPPPHQFTVRLRSPANLMGFRYLPRQDGHRNGVIARFRFFVSTDGVNWGLPVAQGDFSDLGAVNSLHTVIFGRLRTNHRPTLVAPARQTISVGERVSLRTEGGDVDGDVLGYTATGLPAGLGIAAGSGLITGSAKAPGTFTSTVTVQDPKGASAAADIEWTVQAASGPVMPDCTPTGTMVCHVKLEALSEIDGRPFTSMAEFNLLDSAGQVVPRAGWAVSADSVAVYDAPINVLDGDPRSIWHTRWDGAAPPPPHSLIVHLAAPADIGGFRYLPRQDGVRNGTIARYRFHVSRDGVDWGAPVSEGDMTILGSSTAEKTVYLK